jgi:TolB-like protein/Flp pilus assembly protein TadD
MTVQLDALRAALTDRYTLARELGAGGMATVYLAHDQKLNRSVALKVLKPELAAAIGPERFLREIAIAAKLTHPNILALHDCGTASLTEPFGNRPSALGDRPSANLLYYTMPYVEGESLRDRLTREKQLPLDDALQITREVADALGYAHALGLVHRDIKPENILFQAGHALVADFGIAKAIAAVGSARLTETGLAIGTPAYMSPEQAAGNPDTDGRSDLYSLGCVLYEMLAGDPPFYASTPQAVLAKKLSEPLPRVSVVREAVPPGIEAALNKVLAKTPADRFATAMQFAEALSHRETMPPAPPVPAAPWWHRRAVRLAAVGAVMAVLVAITVGGLLVRARAGAGYPRSAIAVLPFENLSAAGPNAYFAGGLHDELLTQLAMVTALSVRARTSVMGYAGTTMSVKRIAGELQIGTIVEGSVQVIGTQLRVNIQLIDAATDRHLWAEHYDRTLDDAFAIQSEIAQRIVEAVGATLTAAEAGALAAAPTRNAEAYQLYLQGLEYWRRPGWERPKLESAQQLYEQALALDSTFALAHAALSTVHGQMSWQRYDPSPARVELQQREAETALRFAPHLPRAHFAMGLVHYWGHRDYAAALKEFNLALRGAPKDAELWEFIGYVHRRLGHWDSVGVAYREASQLDPQNANLVEDLGGGTSLLLRRYADALVDFRAALALAPDFTDARVDIGQTYALWRADLDTLRALWAATGSQARSAPSLLTPFLDLWLWARAPDSLVALLAASGEATVAGYRSYRPTVLYAAWAHLLRGQTGAAHAAFDSATRPLDSAVRALSDDWRVHAALGQALAGLGRGTDALREAEWLAASGVYREDHYLGPDLGAERAQILVRVGETEAALAEIERLLAGPSMTTSVHTLRLDPRWDPIREDPRFQALLVKYADQKPVLR